MAHRTLRSILESGEALLGALEAEDYEAALAHVLAREVLVSALPPAPAPEPALAGCPDGPLGARLRAQHAELTEALAWHAEAHAEALRQNGRARHAAGQYAGGGGPPASLRGHG